MSLQYSIAGRPQMTNASHQPIYQSLKWGFDGLLSRSATSLRSQLPTRKWLETVNGSLTKLARRSWTGQMVSTGLAALAMFRIFDVRGPLKRIRFAANWQSVIRAFFGQADGRDSSRRRHPIDRY